MNGMDNKLKRMRRLAGALLLLAGAVSAQDATPAATPAAPEAPPARAQLDADLAACDKTRDEQLARFRTAYQTALETLANKERAAGNLETLLEVVAEQERSRGAAWTEPAPAATLPALAELRGKLTRALTDATTENATARVRLLERHIAAIDRRQRDLVRANRIDEAVKLAEESQRAQFELAECKALLPEVPAVAPTPPAEETPPGALPDSTTDMPRVVLRLDFDGNDLKNMRKEGGGRLREKDGRLLVEEYGANTRRTPFFGMRAVSPTPVNGDFRIELLADVEVDPSPSGKRAALLGLNAHFSNRSEVGCDVRGDTWQSQAAFRVTGQPDRLQEIELNARPRRGDDANRMARLNPRQLRLIIERRGTMVRAWANELELGSWDLKVPSTQMLGFSIDLQRSIDKETVPYPTSVESVVVRAP